MPSVHPAALDLCILIQRTSPGCLVFDLLLVFLGRGWGGSCGGQGVAWGVKDGCFGREGKYVTTLRTPVSLNSTEKCLFLSKGPDAYQVQSYLFPKVQDLQVLVYVFRALVSKRYLWHSIQKFLLGLSFGKYFTFQEIQIYFFYFVRLSVCFILDWNLRSYCHFYLHFHLENLFPSLIYLQLFKGNDLF